MYTAGSKVDLNDSLCLQILWVKRDFLFLPLSVSFNQERIAEIIVMKMKRCLVIPVVIGFDNLPVGDSCIFDEHIYIRAAFPIRPADNPFDRKTVVGFMRRRHNRGESSHYCNG